MSRSTVIIAVVGILLLAALFIFLRPQNPPNPVNTAPVVTTEQVLPTPSEKMFELKIADGKIVSGEETLSVMEGEKVIFEVTSDVDEEFHLHGYDLSIDLSANAPTQLEFTAAQTGRFPFELEHSGTELGALEVSPK